MTPKSNATWALESANRAIAEFSTAGAIDTANYQHCSFFLAAAEIVRQDPDLLERVGALMEPPRPGTGDEL